MTTPRWFEPKVTLSGAIQIVLLLFALVGAYYGVVGRADGQAKDIASLQIAVMPIPQIQTDISLIKNTISAKSVSRDKQFDDLQARVDTNQTAVSAKLDKLGDQMTILSNQVSALNATLTAQARRP